MDLASCSVLPPGQRGLRRGQATCNALQWSLRLIQDEQAGMEKEQTATPPVRRRGSQAWFPCPPFQRPASGCVGPACPQSGRDHLEGLVPPESPRLSHPRLRVCWGLSWLARYEWCHVLFSETSQLKWYIIFLSYLRPLGKSRFLPGESAHLPLGETPPLLPRRGLCDDPAWIPDPTPSPALR